jgi:glycogen debranching enzyme
VAAAPLFSFTSWEIAQAANDPVFLADAYAAGKALHGFWVAERDQDQDGLAEWGSVAESLRAQGNVIWTLVAPPAEVEAVDLNAMLVMEETSLASMATALGLGSEAAGWQAAADARAARINAVMWDDVTGFYYDVSLATHGFTVALPGDLERMTIAGLLPLWAGIVPEGRRARLVAHLADPTLFLRADGVATLSARDPFYAPQVSGCCLWNGPVVVPWEWLVVRGLRAAGEGALADTIVGRTRAAVAAELARDHQLRERYDADDPARANGSNANDRWSTLMALMMLEAG